MELSGDVNESRSRPFPDPLPPPHGYADFLAELKREELMWALHRERIRKEMILRQLGETERALAASFGHPGLQALPPSQEDYWHHRRPPSLPPSPWDEAAPRPPPAVTDHPPGFPFPWSSAAVRPPPVYPHVDRSPSPPPADDGDQQQKCGSPGAAVRPMLSGDLEEGCRSPSKRTLPEAALVSLLSASNANAGAGMMLSAAEVTSGDRRADGGEAKHDVDEGHDVQPFCQSSEQRETVESSLKNQSDELVVRPCPYEPASEENGASSDDKRIAFGEPLHGSGNQCTEQAKIAESTVKCQTDELLAWPCWRASEQNGASDEQNRKAFIECVPATCRSSGAAVTDHPPGFPFPWTSAAVRPPPVYPHVGRSPSPPPVDDGDQQQECRSPGAAVRPMLSGDLRAFASKEDSKEAEVRWTCDLCQVSKPSPRGLATHCASSTHQLMLEHVTRNKQPPPGLNVGGGPSWPSGGENADQWTCRLCDSRCGSASVLQHHLGGRKHRANAAAVLAMFRSSITALKHDAAGGLGRSEYYCRACDVRCADDTMLASHLVEKRHRLDWLPEKCWDRDACVEARRARRAARRYSASYLQPFLDR